MAYLLLARHLLGTVIAYYDGIEEREKLAKVMPYALR